MRIAFVPAARVLSEREPNGEALIAVAMLRKLAERGHDLIAYCERADVSIEGVDVREISAEGPTPALGRLAFARRIAHDAAREHFDIAHVLFPFTTDDGYATTMGAPLVCGPVNVPWPQPPRKTSLPKRAVASMIDKLERRRHKRTLGRAARVLVTGPSARAALPKDIHDRAVDVPFGIDLARFPATPLPDEPVILFLSVLQPRKGVDVLLRAMPDVLQRVPRARLVLAGADPHGLRPSLELLARDLGVADRVAFYGDVSPDEAPAMYGRCRVFCQPSIGEPFGMTVIEAMASARPVVGTAAGGIPDAVLDRQGGRLAPAGDPRLLGDALARVLERPEEAERMAAFNRTRAEQRYALDKVVERIERMYEDVLEEAARAATAS